MRNCTQKKDGIRNNGHHAWPSRFRNGNACCDDNPPKRNVVSTKKKKKIANIAGGTKEERDNVPTRDDNYCSSNLHHQPGSILMDADGGGCDDLLLYESVLQQPQFTTMIILT
mmetsp:Transcript_24483/g.37249  ORF Transcript_24483/g.37249 Transcript_24483/m.37249 type:complete len:113 (+) Transcript_24483:488-826(+)